MKARAGSVAVIGMTGRFPGAHDIEEFWANLIAGRDSIRRFQQHELDAEEQAKAARQSDYIPARGIIEDVDKFDSAFFAIPPREADVLDPQQRLFLEMAWHALEDAGYAPGTTHNNVGIFAGMSNNTYYAAHVAVNPHVLEAVGDVQAMLGNEKDYLSTRVAYKLNLRGPAVNIYTACSTSLVAVCHAYNSLVAGQCDMAIAGGVSVSCPQERGYVPHEGGIYSADGTVRSFDAAATGTVFSNGAGIVVLKRLEDAVSDGDTIHAVIRGAGMNNDGSDKVSFTAPSVTGQADVIRLAHRIAGVRPGDVTYVEAHATGTALGDPIELAGLAEAFADARMERPFCGIGCVKSNIGHLDAAAGIAGLLKTVLALKYKTLPGTVHFERPNPELGIENSPFYVVDKTRPWDAQGKRRIAGVSSFGVGGTNAHAVLEEAPEPEPPTPSRAHQLFALSARTSEALQRAVEAAAKHLRKMEPAQLPDLAYTLAVGRRAFDYRLAIAGSGREQVIAALERAAQHRVDPLPDAAATSGVIFMFPGQGAQHVKMGQGLYGHEAVFRSALDECAGLFDRYLDLDIRDLMFGRIENAEELLAQTRYTQPALFAYEYALACQWRAWGVEPGCLIGHSIGEYVAGVLAGVFELADAAKLVAARGRLMQECPAGGMLYVNMTAGDVEQRLSDGLSIAAVNAPEFCVVAGSHAAVKAFKKKCDTDGITAGYLRTSHAFHSQLMDKAATEFAKVVRTITLHESKKTIISTATGNTLGAQATDPEYWAAQIRKPVLFARAVAAAGAMANGVFLEVGPGRATSVFASQTLETGTHAVVTSIGPVERPEQEAPALLEALGRAWSAGVKVDWHAFYAGEKRRRVPGPTYRFERKRHWLDRPGRGVEEKPPAAQATADVTLQKDVAGTGSLIAELRAALADVSGVPVDEFEPETSFVKLGLDSLLLTQFTQTLKKRFDVSLRFRQLLSDYPNLKALAAHIGDCIGVTQKPPVAARKIAPSPVNNGAPPAGNDERVPARAFGPAARISRSGAEQGPTDSQAHYLQQLQSRYLRRTAKSRAFVQENRRRLSDPRTVSGFDPALKETVYPLVVESARGARLLDIDGNEYIDLVNGFGSNFIGYSPDFINRAIAEQLEKSVAIGPQTPLAGEVASLVCELTGHERVAFCTTGSESVLAAVRAARTVTGRDIIVTFDGDYHGIFDEVIVRAGADGVAAPAAPGIPAAMHDNIEVLTYGSRAAIDHIHAHADRIAAVLVEPVQGRHPDRYSAEFLGELRRVTAQCDIALIFDEMVTGFRVHPSGVQGLTGIRADLATYGKVAGGGLPIGILAGTAKYMDALDGGYWAFGDDSAPEADVTFFAGTHVRHPLALAAAKAALSYIKDKGPDLQCSLEQRTAELVAELERHCEATEAPIRFNRFSSWFSIDIDPRVPCSGLLFCRLRLGGIHVCEGRHCFLTLSHTAHDLAQISRVFREALEEMCDAGFFADAPVEKAQKTLQMEQPIRTGHAVAGTSEASDATAPCDGARLGRRPNGEPAWFVPDPERPGKYREVTLQR